MRKKPSIGAQLAQLRWANATEADRATSRANGKLGGRPVCACLRCPACLRRARAFEKSKAAV